MGKDSQTSAPDAAFLNEHCAKVNGADLALKGMTAFDDIKGLTFQYIKGVIITLFVAAAIFTLKFIYIYQPFIAPYIDGSVEKITNFWSLLSYVVTPVAWILKFVSWIILIFTSMKITAILMSFWLDTLIEKVIGHFREIPDEKFSFSKTAKNTLIGLGQSAGNLIFSIIFMVLGFIPLIGPVFAFIGNSCSNGFDIMSPYLMILADKDDKVLKDFKITKAKTFSTGFVQTILTFIPAVGWFALPFTLLAQVVGYAYYCEETWQEQNKKVENS